MILGALYHWSPIDRRPLVQRDGLMPNSPPTNVRSKRPFVCLAASPGRGWDLIADARENGVREWDLWQVRVVRQDGIGIYSDLAAVGLGIKEVRVYTPIPVERVWFVGSRRIHAP